MMNDTLILPIVGETGDGKTLGSVCYAYALTQMQPEVQIVSNIRIFMENAIYSPFLLMPFKKLQEREKLVIVDDCRSLRNLDGFLTFVASASRKANTHVILTGQDHTHIPPEVRRYSTHAISRFSYDKDVDVVILELKFKPNEDGEKKPNEYWYFENAVKECGGLFKTGQINELPEDYALENELLFQSENKFDLRKNAFMLYRDKRERRSVVKRLEADFPELRKKAIKERKMLIDSVDERLKTFSAPDKEEHILDKPKRP